MPRSEKIAERLPHFYRYWENDSVVASLIDAMGKRLDEAEKEFIAIMRAHWVDTANKGDLDKLSSLYNLNRKAGVSDSYHRKRLKTAIIRYEGGGTIDAVREVVKLVLRPPEKYLVEIVENPPVNLKETWKVKAGREWSVNPRNIHEVVPDITITLSMENTNITSPTLINNTTGESITFNGNLVYGDILKISNGQAFLNGEDQTDKLSTTDIPRLPRGESKWQYTERIGANLGKFDEAQFDNSFFATDIVSNVTFEWTANQPATFELHLPKELLLKARVSAEFMQEILNSVKASGVKADVKVI